ncbi:1-aminocyclopropane-1-carboxylate deaminase/D-cysteine desulfhydrase [Psychroflexus salis]|uniref:1-aminocyclopropane-1-carboxylate deaminase/D-cysteine desulfhydrase n=1 Tax=Psychroflexus salis TaxID=1526574 RepID=UPI001666AEB9|nr:pyridoxal-phosphate dependent enzyme [Psychroflexus salis]
MQELDFFHTKIRTRHQLVCKDASTGIELWIKREDEIHPVVSGNKFRKLKYNLLQAQKEGKTKLLTFGGAYSNHIAATAKAARLSGLQSIGIIRGDELAKNFSTVLQENSTLKFAHLNGMQFYFETRENYQNKYASSQLEKYKNLFGEVFVIPEGGTNALAIQGCKEILSNEDSKFDVICSSAGTGGTVAGLIEAASNHQEVIAFSALKGNFLKDEIKKWTSKTNWQLNTDFHLGGYAKVSEELIQFINSFYTTYQIPLDPIYTGKMLFGLFQLIKSGYFSENTRILAIHTGGLQGVESMNKKLQSQNKEIITFK